MCNYLWAKKSERRAYTAGTSFYYIGLKPGVDVSFGTFKSFMYLAFVYVAGRLENPISSNFFGFKLLCQ